MNSRKFKKWGVTIFIKCCQQVSKMGTVNRSDDIKVIGDLYKAVLVAQDGQKPR